MGQLEQDEGNWEESLDYFERLQKVDEDFCADIVNLRIGEALYKLMKVKEAIKAIEISAKTIKDKDRYMIHLLKGKCFDKLKDFPSAVEEYQLALQNAKDQSHDDEIVGNLEFRLGWSLIRQRDKIEEGVNHLINASELISDNVEILLKLAATIMSDLSERPDFLEKCSEALDRIIEMEPNNS